jgi:general secretion pathway protein M
MNLASALGQFRQTLAEFWALRDQRERLMLAFALLVATGGLVYIALINPALTGRDQLNKNLPLLRQQVAEMQALSKQAALLSGKPAMPALAMSRENIEASLARNGLKSQSVTLTGGYAKVQLVAVSFSSALNWLDEIQRSEQRSVVDANVVVQIQPDKVNATFTLR